MTEDSFDFGEIMRQRDADEISDSQKEALYEAARQAGVDRRQDDDESGVVYYIRTCCRIKIGYTKNLGRRMMELTPDEVLATEVGTRETEWVRHRQFAASNIRGEWFEQSPALMAHIRALQVRHHSAETDNPGERFITTASAITWTGRSRQVLYRWASEGRITRYGTPGQALWDVFELPARRSGSAAPPPPRRAVRLPGGRSGSPAGGPDSDSTTPEKNLGSGG